MKKNIIFVAGKLFLLALVIGMTSAFGRILQLELGRKYTDAGFHYLFIIVFASCVLFLLFIAFYLAHQIAARDYKYFINKSR